MGLIDSTRLSDQDRSAWAERERYDTALAAAPYWPAREEAARQVVRDFAAAGACYASTSWGKDSTAMAHIVATSGVRLPLVYVRPTAWENPDCLTVRDAFLDRYGDLVDYEERWVTLERRWWDPEGGPRLRTGAHAGGQFTEAEHAHGGRHISGVRGEESRMRRMAMGRWGDAGPGACRPIGRWTAVDVFAYLHRHDLPIHPAYAMSYGGRLDRRWIRVSPIGGISGADKVRASWEQDYYPDIVRRP